MTATEAGHVHGHDQRHEQEHDHEHEHQDDSRKGVIHVPAGEGPTVWMSGDTYTVKASKESTGGVLSFMEASIPPGAGPVPHVHAREDEAYYVLTGQLEVLDGDRFILAGPGDFVFIPRGTLHRFKNVGVHVARMLFLFTPAGFDEFFLAAGQPAVPGEPIPEWGPEQERRAVELASDPKYGWSSPVLDAAQAAPQS